MSRSVVDFAVKTFGDASAKVVFTFPVLYQGWESDGEGYVVETKGEKKLILTNHGSPYVADVSELDDFFTRYKQAIEATEGARHLLIN